MICIPVILHHVDTVSQSLIHCLILAYIFQVLQNRLSGFPVDCFYEIQTQRSFISCLIALLQTCNTCGSIRQAHPEVGRLQPTSLLALVYFELEVTNTRLLSQKTEDVMKKYFVHYFSFQKLVKKYFNCRKTWPQGSFYFEVNTLSSRRRWDSNSRPSRSGVRCSNYGKQIVVRVSAGFSTVLPPLPIQ